MWVSTHIHGTENKIKHNPNTRHHEQEGKKKNMAKSEWTNSDCNIKKFSKSEKAHNGGQTWKFVFLIQRKNKLHELMSLNVK